MFGFRKKKILPIMCRIAKMYKNPTCTRVIIASKSCSIEQLFPMSLSLCTLNLKISIKKFLSSFNNFWVLSNPDPNKSIATYDFLTLNTKPYDKLKSKIFIHF